MGAPARLFAAICGLSAALLASSASAEAPGAVDGADEEAGEPIKLDVLVTERGPGRPWRLRITNVSDEPVRVVTDPRLLSLEVAVPDQQKTVSCELPSQMAPSTPVPESIMRIKPGRWVMRRFDPRMFCFSTSGQQVLVPGAVVTPTFGWKTPTKTVWKKGRRVEQALPEGAPWLAEPVEEEKHHRHHRRRHHGHRKHRKHDDRRDGSRAEASEASEADESTESLLRPIKHVVAAPITLGPDYEAWAPPSDEDDDEPEEREPMALSITRGVDATDERGVVLTIALKNQSKTSQRVFFRRELVTFEVFGPDGLVECQAEPDARHPPPTAFTRLGAGSRSTLATRVVELCPRGTFGRPGFYLVGARLDAQVDGAEYDLDTFVGTVRTERPVTVRVRKGEDPFYIGLRRRPRSAPNQGAPPAPGVPGAPSPQMPQAPPPVAPPPAAPPPSGGSDSQNPPSRPRRPAPPPSSPS